MAAHRYWRILLKATGGGPNGGIGELQMHSTIGGTNVATGGTPSASSVFGGTTYPAAKAFDGLTTDTGTGNAWAASGFAGSGGLSSRPWLMYDFGASTTVDVQEIVIYAPGTGGLNVNDLPTAWDWQYSDDNLTWTTQSSYAFNSETAAWTNNSSRVYDVRKLGAINIHNYMLFNDARWHPYTAPGQPGNPVYDPNSAAAAAHVVDRLQYYQAQGHGGLYKLAGTTTVLGNPAPRRVRLYHQFDGRLYAEKYTNADGTFLFTNLEIGPWTVVGVDDTGNQNGVIFTHVNAVPM